MRTPPDNGLSAERRRTLLQQAIRERGPDAGRVVNHTVMRSLSPALLEATAGAEITGLAVPEAGLLTLAPGVPAPAGANLFMLSISALDGADVLG